ncbi:MAG TPA: hypothetical protein ENN19_17210 [Chloroflexi bacterium]|nr:hypothetical protein [Chloroflexota bacterium]
MINEFFNRFSEFIARMPGLPILIALSLILLNFVLQLLIDAPIVGWMAQTNCLLHLGLVIGLLGLLLGEAL